MQKIEPTLPPSVQKSDQPLQIKTLLEPIALLDALQEIERKLGRKKIIEKGPRNIDLDILLYEDEIINHERLKVPHPGVHEREFVLRPLSELLYVPTPKRVTLIGL